MMQRVRENALSADTRITESIKWSTPTFSFKGNIFSFNPAKKFVSLLFHTGAHIPGRHPRLEGDTDTARVMRSPIWTRWKEAPPTSPTRSRPGADGKTNGRGPR